MGPRRGLNHLPGWGAGLLCAAAAPLLRTLRHSSCCSLVPVPQSAGKAAAGVRGQGPCLGSRSSHARPLHVREALVDGSDTVKLVRQGQQGAVAMHG
jgi:hypothetical protein